MTIVREEAHLIDSPTISVVMPIYNAQQDLHQAIESILNQSFTDFELLIIDDGSTDQSVQIVRSFSDPRIRLMSQSANLGLVAALNTGIANARGQFIARMDGDDLSLPERFTLQLAAMQDQQLDICGSHWVQIDVMGNPLTTLYAPKLDDEVIATLATTVPYAHGSIMLRKSFIHQYALQYQPGYSEDYALWIRCFELGAKFGLVDAVLYLHRTHPQSITSMKSAEQASSAKQLRRAFVKNNLDACEHALKTLQERFQTLPRALQVHALYLSYRVFSCTGNTKPFFNLLLKTPLINQLRALGRIARA